MAAGACARRPGHALACQRGIGLARADHERHPGPAAPVCEQLLDAVVLVRRQVVELSRRAVGVDPVHPRGDQDVDLLGQRAEIDLPRPPGSAAEGSPSCRPVACRVLQFARRHRPPLAQILPARARSAASLA